MSGKFVTRTHLLTDTSGNVMPLAAVGLVVMAAMIGGGVDMSRAYKVQSRLQAACDAGVLAGRRTVGSDGFTTTVQNQASAYFNTNFNQGEQGTRGTSFSSVSPDNGDTIIGTATATVDTAVMKIFGFTTMPLTVTCTASMGMGNSDITMVLDSSGSMAGTRIAGLKTAMKNFYVTVANAANGSGARIRYAFAPYNSAVNVGHLLMELDPDYLVDTYRIQSRQWVIWNSPVITSTPQTIPANFRSGSTTKYGSSFNTLSLCNAALPAATAWVNNGSPTASSSAQIDASAQKIEQISSTQPQIRTGYVCKKSSSKYYFNWRYEYQDLITSYLQTSTPREWLTDATHAASANDLVYRQVQYDVGAYKQFQSVQTLTGKSGSAPAWATSAIWNGCIEERASASEAGFAYDAGSKRITPTEAVDLDIDTPPDASDDSTRWAPKWYEVAYYRTDDGSNEVGDDFSFFGSSASPNYCPAAAQKLTEMAQAAFDTYADSLVANGYTYHDIGLLWGARLSSPQGIWADNVNATPSNGSPVTRHMIFMTDGEMFTRSLIQTTYGIEWHDRRVTDDGVTDNNARHISRFLALCEAVKAKGIRLWVIAFGSDFTTNPDPATWSADQTNLWQCATAGSAFVAADSTTLNQNFQTIAKTVGELRITQ